MAGRAGEDSPDAKWPGWLDDEGSRTGRTGTGWGMGHLVRNAALSMLVAGVMVLTFAYGLAAVVGA